MGRSSEEPWEPATLRASRDFTAKLTSARWVLILVLAGAVAGGIATFITQDNHLHALPTEIWVAGTALGIPAALLGLLWLKIASAVVRTQRDEARTEAQKLREQQWRERVSTSHQRVLHEYIDQFRESAEIGLPPTFEEGPSGRTATESFLAHFPSLSNELRRWEEAVYGSWAASNRLSDWIVSEAKRRGVWQLGNKDFFEDLQEMVCRTAPNIPPLTWHRYDSRDSVQLTLNDMVSVDISAERSEDRQAQCETFTREVEELIRKACAGDGPADIRRAKEAVAALREPLLEQLARHAHIDPILAAPACPICQAQHGQGRP